jgi:hypothetical protein
MKMQVDHRRRDLRLHLLRHSSLTRLLLIPLLSRFSCLYQCFIRVHPWLKLFLFLLRFRDFQQPDIDVLAARLLQAVDRQQIWPCFQGGDRFGCHAE